MIDLEATLQGLAARTDIESEAKMRYAIGSSAASGRQSRYDVYHQWYAPIDGDQWVADRAERPGKLHHTVNIIQAFVDTEARLLSILPRVTNKAPRQDESSRKRAEGVEDLFARYLEMSEWDLWLSDWNRVGGLYGLKVLHPYWNEAEKRPDVIHVEQPQNLVIGWASNDYNVLDWVIYRTSISALEASITYGSEIEVTPSKETGKPPLVTRRGLDHVDPLDQRSSKTAGALAATQASARVVDQGARRKGEADAYLNQHIEVWDYWYRKPGTGLVCNVKMVGGCMVGEVREHPEMPGIPYIISEHDHEPGSPEGRSTVELLVDIQMGINRVLSHWAQVVADNSGTAYQLVGENAEGAPEGLAPKEDELVVPGAGNSIEPIVRNNNPYPMKELLNEYWRSAHKITGLSEILFGELPGSQTAGRAVAIQIEAAANRLDPKRRRTYSALRQLLLFWGRMLEEKNPEVEITEPAPEAEGASDDEGGIVTRKIKIGDAIKGYNRWNIIAPEITPRDATENIQNAIALVQSRLSPLEWAMDGVGIENPQQAMALIQQERSNVRLYPADVQSYASAWLALGAVMQQMDQQEAMVKQAQQAGAAADAAQTRVEGEGAPRPMVDQNQPGQVPGMEGGPMAPGGGQLQPLTRVTPGGDSQAMSQVMGPRVDL